MRGKVVGALAVVGAAIALGGGSHLVGGSCGCSTPTFPTSGSANLWVNTTAGTCSRNASPAAYSSATACGSFQAAYSAASCGDIVGVQSGTYAAQSISSGSKSCGSSAASNVEFTTIPGQPASACTNNTTVDMPDISVSVAHVTEACFTAYDSATSGANCSSVSGSAGQHTSIIWNVFDHIKFRCAFLDSDHMVISNSSFGPDQVCQHTLEDTVDFRSNTDEITDVTMTGNTFLAQSDGGVSECGTGRHIDMMQGYGAADFVIEKSTWTGCYSECIIFRPFNGGVPGPITIENNYFDQVEHPGQAVEIGDNAGPDNCTAPILVDYNTLESGASVHGGCTTTVTIRANILSDSACNQSNFSWDHNVWLATSGATCGTNTKHCTPTLLSPGNAPDYDLDPSDTCAVDAGDPANKPADDIHGTGRPIGANPDAGANEVS